MESEHIQAPDEHQDSENEGQDAETVDEQQALGRRTPEDGGPTFDRTIPPPD